MKRILTLLCFTISFSLVGQTKVLIPDANLVTYLQTLVPSAMSGDSLDTTNVLVTTSTYTINVRAKHISNLTGVQYFTSLKYLDCSQNTISNLPVLANSVQTLWCSNNHLTALPTLPTALKSLYCDSNMLQNLPTLPNLLMYLTCGFNQLTSIPTLPNSFRSLYCCANNITSLPTLPSLMQYLNCTVNSLNSLPPSLPNSIQVLYLGDNNLTSLPTLPNQLKYFSCDYNELTNLPLLPNSITWFICYNNYLTSLPVLPTSLAYFDCSSNNITCFPTFPSSITHLNIQFNSFNCLPNYIPAMGTDTITYPLCTAGNSNGCPSQVGIEKFKNQNIDFKIYPTPANSFIQISGLDFHEGEIKVYDVLGNTINVSHSALTGDNEILDISYLQSGVYFVRINSSIQKFIKE